MPPLLVQGFGVTLFERLQQQWGSEASVMLTVQYRMNRVICAWASEELYQVRGVGGGRAWRGGGRGVHVGVGQFPRLERGLEQDRCG